MSSGRFRRGRWEMTIFAPPSFMSAIIQFESKALPAMRAPNWMSWAAPRRLCHGVFPATEQNGPDCRRRPGARESWPSGRPWTCPWPGPEAPFRALSVAVDLDDGGAGHGVFHAGFIRDGVGNTFENIGFHPVAESFEHRVPLAKPGRRVAPGAARPRNPQHRLEK